MNKMQNLHREAMAFADEAFVAKQQGKQDDAVELFQQAFEREKQAADIVSKDLSAEPTRSILHRSAATLALDCNKLRDAERLVAQALAGDPPDEIAEELRNLLEQIHFQRHLRLHGVTLNPKEFQISISGKAVGYGFTQSDLFVGRIKNTENILYRTAERILKKPYRDRGRKKKQVQEKIQLFFGLPRAASFAVTLRIGETTQTSIPGASLAEDVISEFMQCIDIFNNADEIDLKRKIPDESYFRNFVGLARNIAPDGNNISQVGFTTVGTTGERRVALTRTRKEINKKREINISERPEEIIKVEGILQYADSSKGKNQIRIKDDQGIIHKIIVPEGMMSDIVRPLWESEVIVSGIEDGGFIRLEDISPS